MLRFYSDNKDFSALFNEFIPCLYHLLFSAFTALYVVLLSIALLCFMAGLSTDKQHEDDTWVCLADNSITLKINSLHWIGKLIYRHVCGYN